MGHQHTSSHHHNNTTYSITMISSRVAARTARQTATRSARMPYRQPVRFQSTASSSSSGGSSSSGHLAAGLAGGVIGAGVFYSPYTFTPAGRTASTINKTAMEANKKYKEAAQKLQEKTPNADQAVDSIKQFAYSYVAWIPGGRAYVDTAFDDWEKVRQNHKEEADKLVNDAYKQFQDVAKSGLSLETASKAYEVLADLTKKVADLSGDAFGDILDNHPQVKEKLGGNVDQLKRMGEEYGPEAKKQVDETWKQLKDIVAGGVSVSSLNKARQLIDDKVKQVKKLGDEAWNKAYKQANAKELFEKAKSSIDSGNVDDLKKYVDSAVSKAKDKASSGSGGGVWGEVEKYVQMIPQADEIFPKLKQLSEVAQNHKEEGEKLLRETAEDLKKLLEEKSK